MWKIAPISGAQKNIEKILFLKDSWENMETNIHFKNTVSINIYAEEESEEHIFAMSNAYIEAFKLPVKARLSEALMKPKIL